MREQRLLIDGEWRRARSGAEHVVHNGFSGEAVTRQAAADVGDATQALDAAAAAFPEWSASPGATRRELLVAAGELLEARAEAIAETMSEETSGTFGWGMFNVSLAASMFRAAGELAREPADRPVASDVPGLDSRAVRVPLGACVAIAPWNAPVILGTRAVVWALALGNTVVLKASEQSPAVHGAIARALVDAGAPDGVVNLVTNDPADAADVVGALIDHPAAAHVNFTGSTPVGRVIAQRAARRLTPTLLELGGKAPLLVLDDADLDAAAAAASFGAFMNAGQICMSTERIIVDRRVRAAFVARLRERARALRTGSPFDRDTMVGPVVDSNASRHLAELLDDARDRGAELLVDGTAEGTLHPPTIVDGVRADMRIAREESFGPVVAVTEAADADDAVRRANDTDYGLAAAVFGGDLDRAGQVASRIRSGICHINGATVHDEATAPFGGVKASGWGRFGSGQVAGEFTSTRWVTISREARHYPI